MMMKRIISLYLFYVCFFGSLPLHAQEGLSGRYSNESLVQNSHKKHTLKNVKSSTLVQLPFFDDFSTTTIYPDTSKWTDQSVFINDTYANNPRSLGVASFDFTDANGLLYDAEPGDVVGADTLSSKPINLQYTLFDSIFLSFYYQPGGNCEPPEAKDSLILEFYAPYKQQWIQVWSASNHYEEDTLVEEFYANGNSVNWEPSTLPSQLFKYVLISVKDTFYLHQGFRFRFRNLASLSDNSQDPGRRGNSDIWNIDYVYLDRGRDTTDTLFNDVAIAKPLRSLLVDYEAIPWQHFQRVIDNELRGTIPLTYRNNGPKRSVGRGYHIKELLQNLADVTKANDYENINSDETITYNDDLLSGIIQSGDDSDSAIFSLTSYLETAEDKIFLSNDTVHYLQVFSDYYALDDGSAEMGYGISGINSENASVAVRFDCFRVSDTLQGVRIFFNEAYNNTNLQNFYLTVWNNDNGRPGDILYSKNADALNGSDSLYIPREETLNKFATYYLDTGIHVTSTFFVGWTQTTTDFLHVGYDKNTTTSNRNYININGTWQASSYTGAIMIRPVFGRSPQRPNSIISHEDLLEYNIYPNPVDAIIHVQLPTQASNETVFYYIYDLSGRTVTNGEIYNSEINDVYNLPNGFYFLKLQSQSHNFTTQKLIIAHP